jgi:hypothetical protein
MQHTAGNPTLTAASANVSAAGHVSQLAAAALRFARHLQQLLVLTCSAGAMGAVSMLGSMNCSV